ncbi:MAG: cadherin-like domain-containing protein, partial [Deltaproteobacteria bacterium]|nr:cadherin-like domain-containing protein [Deltaproteobacteria bacterium]
GDPGDPGTVQPNRPPMARDDEVTTPQGQSVLIDVLMNDGDPDGDPLTIRGLTQGANGQVMNDSGRVRYTPRAGFVGADSFTVEVCDPDAACSIGTVRVTVTGTGGSGGDRDGDGLSDAKEGELGTDPDVADTDGDGLSDWEEIATDPLDADSDDDGLADGAEVETYGTNPTLADSDGDGLPDGLEAGRGEGIPDGESAGGSAFAGTDAGAGHFLPDLDPTTTTDPAKLDTDGDGTHDGLEDPNKNGRLDPGEPGFGQPSGPGNPGPGGGASVGRSAGGCAGGAPAGSGILLAALALGFALARRRTRA